MPSIGIFSFIEFSGELPLPIAPTVQEITRPNVDGHAFVDVGERAPKCSITTTVDTDTPDALARQHQALQGTLVTVVSPDGSSISNVMVEHVRKLNAQASIKAVGGVSGGSWLLTEQWILQPT